MNKILLIIFVALLIVLIGCQNGTKKILSPYYALDDNTYSIIIISEKKKFMEESQFSIELVKKFKTSIIKAGVVVKESKEGQQLIDFLNINNFPRYLLLDSKGILINEDEKESYYNAIEKVILRR